MAKCPECNQTESVFELLWVGAHGDEVRPLRREIAPGIIEGVQAPHGNATPLYCCGACEIYFNDLDLIKEFH